MGLLALYCIQAQVELDVFDVGTGHFDDLADQRVAVGVRARGRQGEQGRRRQQGRAELVRKDAAGAPAMVHVKMKETESIKDFGIFEISFSWDTANI